MLGIQIPSPAQGQAPSLILHIGSVHATVPADEAHALVRAYFAKHEYRGDVVELHNGENTAVLHFVDCPRHGIEMTRFDASHLLSALELVAGATAGARPIALLQIDDVAMHICRTGEKSQALFIKQSMGPLWSASELLELRALIDKFIAHYIEGRGRML